MEQAGHFHFEETLADGQTYEKSSYTVASLALDRTKAPTYQESKPNEDAKRSGRNGICGFFPQA